MLMDPQDIQKHIEVLLHQVHEGINKDVSELCDFSSCITKILKLVRTVTNQDDVSYQTKHFNTLMSMLKKVVEEITKREICKTLQDVSTMFNETVAMMHNIFKFIKESSVKLECAGKQKEEIRTLVQTTYNILKEVSDLFGRCSEVSGQELTASRNVFAGLIQCTVALADVDVLACVNIWKVIRRGVMAYKENIKGDFDDFVVVFDVCLVCCKAVEQWKSSQDKISGTNNKLQKVVQFFFSIVLQITMEFMDEVNSECCLKLVHVIVFLQKDDFQDEMACTIRTLKDSLVSTLLVIPCAPSVLSDVVNSPYLDIKVLNYSNDSKHFMSFLLELLGSLSKCNNISDVDTLEHWLNIPRMRTDKTTKELHVTAGDDEKRKNTSVLNVVVEFASIHCIGHVFQDPGNESVTTTGMDRTNGSFYNDILSSICEFISMLPTAYFAHVEEFLLHGIMGEGKVKTMLTSDVWFFVARLGTKEVCLEHFIFLGNYAIQYSSVLLDSVLQNVLSLFQRLFWCLSGDQHNKILNAFPMSSETVLAWSYIPVWHLEIDNRTGFIEELCTFLVGFTNVEEEMICTDREIVQALRCLGNVTSGKQQFRSLNKIVRQSIVSPVVEFWMCFNDVIDDIEMNESLTVSMLQLLSDLLHYLSPSDQLVMLRSMSKVLSCIDSLAFHLHCCHVLSRLKRVIFHEDLEVDCLHELSIMFQFLLNSTSWFVQTSAMSALKEYAEMTTYSKAVSSFLPATKRKEFGKFLKKQSGSNVHPSNLYEGVKQILFDEHLVNEPRKGEHSDSMLLGSTGQLQQSNNTEHLVGCKKRKYEDAKQDEVVIEEIDHRNIDRKSSLEYALERLEASVNDVSKSAECYENNTADGLPEHLKVRIEQSISSLQCLL